MSVPDVLVELIGVDNMRGAHRRVGHDLRLILEAIADVAVGIFSIPTYAGSPIVSAQVTVT
jgi:hypothetical protein